MRIRTGRISITGTPIETQSAGTAPSMIVTKLPKVALETQKH